MTNTTEPPKGPPLLLSARFLLALLTCLCCANIYQQRINLSVAIVAMVNHTALLQMENKEHLSATKLHSKLRQFNDTSTCQLRKATATEAKKGAGNLVWSKDEQGTVLASFFWGLLPTRLLGGWLAERYGTKQVMFVFVLISTIATLTIPTAARISYIAVCVVRVIAGIGQGGVFPALLSQWGRWAPPLERSLLIGISYAGCDIGIIAFFPIDGYLCDAVGWSTVFYTSGAVGLLWCVLWQLFASSSPAESRWVRRTELRYIQRSLPAEQNQNGQKRRTPWRSILASPAVWALFCVYWAENSSYYFISTLLPTYMHEVLHFDIRQNGMLSALPYVACALSIYVTVSVADFVLRRQLMTTTVVRKCCSILAMIGTGTTLVAAGYCDCRTKYLAIGFIIAAQTFVGVHNGGLFPATIDIAPQFGGTITGICTTSGAVSGSVIPVIAAAMTPNHTASEWRSVFWLLFGVNIAAALVFLFFGDAKLQSWAVVDVDDSDTNADKNSQQQLNRDTTPLL